MRQKLFNTILLVLIASNLAVAAVSKTAAQDSVKMAIEFLKEKKYNEASNILTNVELDFHSEALYQNVVYAFFQQGDWYHSRFYAEKGLLLYPDSQKLIELNQKIKDEIEDYYYFPKYPLDNFYSKIHGLIGNNGLSLFLMISSIVSFGYLIYLRYKKTKVRKGFIFAIIGSLSILTLLILFEIRADQRIQLYKLVRNTNIVHIAPDEISESITQLKAGHKVKQIDVLGEWTKIELADGNQGWIISQSF